MHAGRDRSGSRRRSADGLDAGWSRLDGTTALRHVDGARPPRGARGAPTASWRGGAPAWTTCWSGPPHRGPVSGCSTWPAAPACRPSRWRRSWARRERSWPLDRSAGMLQVAAAEAERLGLANLQVQEADAHDLPWPDESFDLVTCRYGVSWFDEPRRALRGGAPGAAAGRAGRLRRQRLGQPADAERLPRHRPTQPRACAGRSPTSRARPATAAPARYATTCGRRASPTCGSAPNGWRAAGRARAHRCGRSRRRGCEPELADLSAERRRSLGRTVVASLERHRRGTVLHLPIHVHLATATKA